MKNNEKVCRDSQGRWKKGSKSPNPKGRPPTSVSFKNILGPKKEELVEVIVQKALEGDISALKFCLSRLFPPLKPESEKVFLGQMPIGTTLKEKSDAILDSTLKGEISIEVGLGLMQNLSSQAKIIEFENFEERLLKLELALSQL